MAINIQTAVDEILDQFDFEEVRRAMEALDCSWTFAAEGVPSIAELRKCARSLLMEAASYHGNAFTVETGGFRAGKSYGLPTLELSFYIDSRRLDDSVEFSDSDYEEDGSNDEQKESGGDCCWECENTRDAHSGEAVSVDRGHESPAIVINVAGDLIL